MADRVNAADTPTRVTQLVGGIVADLQTLVRQELVLAKTEMRQEWDKAKTAASSMAIGAVLLSVGGLLVCFGLVYLLYWVAPGLPLWAWYGIVGVALGLIGGILVGVGRGRATEVHVIPPRTAETLKENVQWLRNQT